MRFYLTIVGLVTIGLTASYQVAWGAGKAGAKCAKDVDCKGNLICQDKVCSRRDKEKAAESSGCTKDSECKGDRICACGACKEPPVPKSPPSTKLVKSKAVGTEEVVQPGRDLVWLRCPLGQHWTGYACKGIAQKRVKWEVAASVCPMGYRLPTREELTTLLGGCIPGVAEGTRGYCSACHKSEICTSMFDRDRLMYWSATPHLPNLRLVWRVNFADGGVGADDKRAGRAVRCVRRKPDR